MCRITGSFTAFVIRSSVPKIRRLAETIRLCPMQWAANSFSFPSSVRIQTENPRARSP